MKLLISILGPTCIGKTSISIKLAKFFKTEIISCDSRQFYKELTIGTSCPSKSQLKIIKHHFINHKSIFSNYNVYNYEKDVIKKLKLLYNIYNIIILVGGSFLYEKAIIEGLDQLPEIKDKKKIFLFRKMLNKKNDNYLLNKIKKKDYKFYEKYLTNKKDRRKIIRALEVNYFTQKRISSFFKKKHKIKRPFNNFIRIGLIDKREIIYNNINKNVDNMIRKGLFNEANRLYKYKHLNSLNTIGYKEFFNKTKRDTIYNIIDKIKKNTRNYAKRQIIWLRKIKNITWFNPSNFKKIKKFIIDKIKK
ncbi:MAG: tRNA (adenosine(37)-N6)-dimethylallyltransferase MiaA [Candidatus Shikimatogenerans bostrichidophilus]|nr:MAG: tRNA (adenosine(37)-N6)-dimethylallyltransferase MiaA [Candidatus Shikimatogenerans bostrichidophilus]